MSAATEATGRLWKCAMCHTKAPWGDSWRWYGSIRQEEAEPGSIAVLCSDDCAEAFEGTPLQRRVARSAVKHAKTRYPR